MAPNWEESTVSWVPTQEELERFLDERPNQGRWGVDDQRGALNLITPEVVTRAAGLVRTGQTLSLSRPLPVSPARNNPRPAQHFMKQWIRERDPRAGSVTDHFGLTYHGQAYTHLDALCHQWDRSGMWNGRDAAENITPDGVLWGGVEQWRDGIVGRGVLLDVAAYRGVPYVTADRPVHGDELRAIAEAQGVELQPGDILCVHCGREEYDRTEPLPWGTKKGHAEFDDERPGLHASCLWFFREVDAAALAWDMLDHKPYGYEVPFTVHASIFTLGMALIDNAMLEDVAQRCHETERFEFLFTLAPLVMNGATGSPVNPLAVF